MNRKILVSKYGSIAILWVVVFGIMQVPIIPIVLYFNLNASGYLLLAIPVVIPIAFTLTYSGRKVWIYPARFLFKHLLEPDLEKNATAILQALSESSGLEPSMVLLGGMFDKLDAVSVAFGMKHSEIETGKRVLQMLQELLESDVETKSEFFRIPRFVSADFLKSLMNETFVDHWISNELARHGQEDVVWILVAYCLKTFLQSEHVGRSVKMFDDVNRILHYLAGVQNGPVNYESPGIRESMKKLVGFLTLFVFYIYFPGGGKQVANHRVLVERNLLHWISLVDYSTRSSDFSALEDAPDYFFNMILNSSGSERAIVRELAEEIKSNTVLDPDIFSSLKAYAKLSISPERKLEFISQLRSELRDSDLPDLIRLLENIEFYLGLVKQVTRESDMQDNMKPGLRCSIQPAGENTWRVEFRDRNSDEIALVEDSPLLFDVNYLAEMGNLELLDSLSKTEVTEVAIRLVPGKDLKIKCWPFGVSGSPTDIMGVWPPTIDTASFLKVLREKGYFDGNYSRIADVGCGTGMLGLSFLILSEVESVTFSDISRVTLNWVHLNASLNRIDQSRLSLVKGRSLNWIQESGSRYDIVLLSPPYLPTFLTRNPSEGIETEMMYNDIVNDYSIETVDTGLLYDAIVNFKAGADKLLVLYSSIADDVVVSALRDVAEKEIMLSEKTLYEKVVPLKIPGVVPSDMEEYMKWPEEKKNPLDDLKRRGRLFDPPVPYNSTYPFWQKIKIVEFS